MSNERVPGTLFRGKDGKLYFIPDAALEPFRVFDNVHERIETLLDQQITEQEPPLPAPSVAAVRAELPPEFAPRAAGPDRTL
ncbi:MAG: hypothetical protein OHK0022_13610 [Roseiflexaceae bacterium]